MFWFYTLGALIVVIGAIIFFRRKAAKADKKIYREIEEKREGERVKWADGAASRERAKEEKRAELADKTTSSEKVKKIEADKIKDQEENK